MPEFSDEPNNPGIAGRSVQACREAKGGNLCNVPMGPLPIPIVGGSTINSLRLCSSKWRIVVDATASPSA